MEPILGLMKLRRWGHSICQERGNDVTIPDFKKSATKGSAKEKDSSDALHFSFKEIKEAVIRLPFAGDRWLVFQQKNLKYFRGS